MPPAPTCICGKCSLCRKRKSHNGWRRRKRAGTPLSPEAKSAQARKAILARWANRDRMRKKRDRMYAAAGRVYVKGQGNGRRYSRAIEPEVSDEELDRRAAEMLSKENSCSY